MSAAAIPSRISRSAEITIVLWMWTMSVGSAEGTNLEVAV